MPALADAAKLGQTKHFLVLNRPLPTRRDARTVDLLLSGLQQLDTISFALAAL